MNETSRLASLDGLRGLAAVAVMTFHFNYFFLPQASITTALPFLGRAYLGVDLFFLMSGFVMAHVYGRMLSLNWRTHWWDFATMRFARIYPLFALTTLVMVITHALSHLPLSSISLSGPSLALQPLLLQNWYVGLNWNYASWSISTEAAAYAVFVFAAGPLVRGEYPRLIAAICIAVLAALGISHGGRLHVFYGFSALLRTLAEFSLGALLYRVHRADAAIPGKWLAMFAAVCVALAVLTRWDIPMVGVLACLILYGIDPTTMLARLLNSGPAVALGAWSYSIYLWHAPTHYAVMAVFSALGHPTSNLDTSSAKLLMLATILAVVGLSAFTFKYFETPARRMIRRTLLPREGLLNRSSPRWGTVDR